MLYNINMKAKELIKLLHKNGWVIDRIKGSYHIYRKDNNTISLPVHGNKDIKIGTLKSILKEMEGK